MCWFWTALFILIALRRFDLLLRAYISCLRRNVRICSCICVFRRIMLWNLDFFASQYCAVVLTRTAQARWVIVRGSSFWLGVTSVLVAQLRCHQFGRLASAQSLAAYSQARNNSLVWSEVFFPNSCKNWIASFKIPTFQTDHDFASRNTMITL